MLVHWLVNRLSGYGMGELRVSVRGCVLPPPGQGAHSHPWEPEPLYFYELCDGLYMARSQVLLQGRATAVEGIWTGACAEQEGLAFTVGVRCPEEQLMT